MLPQLVRIEDVPEASRTCPIMFSEADESDKGMLRFDPCGHFISVDAFVGNVRSKVESGAGRDSIDRSPVTGMASFVCPVPGCSGGFVHDIHHYKLCGKVTYDRMKDWIFEADFGEEQPARGGSGEGEADLPGDEAADAEPPTARHVREIQTILTCCATAFCPVCGTAGQKDGACVHVRCEANHRFCYYCLRPRQQYVGYT